MKKNIFSFLQPYDPKQFVKSTKDEKPSLQPPLTFHDLGKTNYDITLSSGLAQLCTRMMASLKTFVNYRDFWRRATEVRYSGLVDESVHTSKMS